MAEFAHLAASRSSAARTAVAVDAALAQDARGDAVALAHEAEQDVLGADEARRPSRSPRAARARATFFARGRERDVGCPGHRRPRGRPDSAPAPKVRSTRSRTASRSMPRRRERVGVDARLAAADDPLDLVARPTRGRPRSGRAAGDAARPSASSSSPSSRCSVPIQWWSRARACALGRRRRRARAPSVNRSNIRPPAFRAAARRRACGGPPAC